MVNIFEKCDKEIFLGWNEYKSVMKIFTLTFLILLFLTMEFLYNFFIRLYFVSIFKIFLKNSLYVSENIKKLSNLSKLISTIVLSKKKSCIIISGCGTSGRISYLVAVSKRKK